MRRIECASVQGVIFLTEAQYQAKLIKKLEVMFPGCVVLRNDPAWQQGILDLLILWREFWASLEVKTSAKANVQPNQDYFVQRLDDMSFAAFIYPDNETEVLDALQSSFGSRG